MITSYYEATKNYFAIMEFVDYKELNENLDGSIEIVKDGKIDSGLVLLPSKICFRKMLVLEKDGSFSAMCGNGVRAVADYIFDNYNFEVNSLNIEILDGLIEVKRLGNKQYEVNMGEVISFDKNPEYFLKNGILNDVNFKLDTFPGIRLFSSRGEPHLILEHEVNDVEAKRIYSEVQKSGNFPNGVNLNLVEIVSDAIVKNLTCERGLNRITQSCGTGSTSVSEYIYEKFGWKNLLVKNKGGNLRFKRNGDKTYICIGEAHKTKVE